MATAEVIQQEIIDWYNQEYNDKMDSRQFGRVVSEFVEAIEWRSKEITLPSGVSKLVEMHGGGEGDGEAMWAVFEVNGQLFRVDGTYASWVGPDWDYAEVYEVEATPVQVIEYKRKK